LGETIMQITLQQLARALGGEVRGNQVHAPGPGHSAIDRSMSVTINPNAPDGFLVNTFSPADDPIKAKDYVREKLGLPSFKPNSKGNGHARVRKSATEIGNALANAMESIKPEPPKDRRIAETYDYTNEEGAPLYQNVRFEPKDFRQRQPDGKGGWIWNLNGCRRVPYKLPEIIAYPDVPLVLTEGEKGSDRGASLGMLCTTVGRDNMAEDCLRYFAGRDVWIVRDMDAPGAVRAHKRASALHGVAATVRVVKLPGLDGTPGKKDLSDWFDLDPDNTVSKLTEVALAAPEWTPETAPAEVTAATTTAPPLPLPWINMSNWDYEPVPEREWSILNRVPLRQAGLFSGEGGTGKSIIELTKNVAHVTGKDWLGSMPERGPAIYVGAEDDEKELHIRLASIAKHYSVTFEELIAGGLHVLCLLGQDATLCAATGKSGKVEGTGLYRQRYEAAGDIKPRNISIDTLSRAFAGSEIDRVQVYGFAMQMQALAKVAGGSVTVLSHPSLQGIASGSGISGSTAWHGAFRFRQYLTAAKHDDEGQPDHDLRQLEFKKNQYGPIGETVVVRYQNGLFVPVVGPTDFEVAAREAAVEDVFLALLRDFKAQGRRVSDRPSPTYAPTEFAQEDMAKKAGATAKALADAMRRLFAANKIWNEPCGYPSRPRYHIAEKP